MKDLLARLTDAFGPSGREEAVRQVIGAELEAMGRRPIADRLGNLVAVAPGRGGGSRILLAAHMDEIGLIVTHVDENGFARFAPVGGHSPQTLLGQRVRFADGTAGTIGVERLDDPKDLKIDKLFIDCGGPRPAVRVGEVCGFAAPLAAAGGERWISHAMDDRVGCLVLLETARALADHPHEIHFAFTVQEEVGLRGARTAGYNADPELALAIDVTATGDTPKARTMDVALGKGAAIKVRDNSLLAHPYVIGWLRGAGERRGIPHQMEVLEFGGTDAGAIHTGRAGVRSGAVSIPCRHVHTPGEMVDAADVRACVDLLVEALSAPLP
jgi:putative aminopeptidase FrvX